MGRERREELIRQIEDDRNSKLLVYVTGDRRGLETKIASDIFPLIYKHLLHLQPGGQVDLFVYTTGGDTLAGWGLVNLIREFYTTLNVIIPFKALSCGTLIALGADSIVLGKGAQLSPIDPAVGSPYNPQAPGSQPGRVNLLPVSVEDMIGFLDLVREEAGIKNENELAKIIEKLSDKVHPLALGAVYRAREQIKTLATNLLNYHLDDPEKVEKIVSKLTKELPSHHYLIGRKEAKSLFGELVVDNSEDPLEQNYWQLYKEYETLLDLITPYNPESLIGTSGSVSVAFDRAIVESLSSENRELKTDAFITEKELRRIQTTQPGTPIPIIAVQERMLDERWKEINDR